MGVLLKKSAVCSHATRIRHFSMCGTLQLCILLSLQWVPQWQKKEEEKEFTENFLCSVRMCVNACVHVREGRVLAVVTSFPALVRYNNMIHCSGSVMIETPILYDTYEKVT